MPGGLSKLIGADYRLSDNQFNTCNGRTVIVVNFLTLLWILRKRFTRKLAFKWFDFTKGRAILNRGKVKARGQ